MIMTTITTTRGEGYGYRSLVIFSRLLVCALVGFSLVYSPYAHALEIRTTSYVHGENTKELLDCYTMGGRVSKVKADAVKPHEYFGKPCGSYNEGSKTYTYAVRYCRDAEYVAKNNNLDFLVFSHWDGDFCVYIDEEFPPMCQTMAGTVKRVSFQQPANYQQPSSF